MATNRPDTTPEETRIDCNDGRYTVFVAGVRMGSFNDKENAEKWLQALVGRRGTK